MLLLSTPAPEAAEPAHHTARELVSADKLFDTAQHLLTDVLPKVLILCLIAWVLIRVLTFFTGRMARVAERHAASPTPVSPARKRCSLRRATGIGIISFLAVLQVLPLVGFNLGPLLASAGVAGVAIGLACQAVVKDCLNGMLFLLEDQFNVGDVVKVASFSGQVEAMTLRKTTLRDGDGTVYIIPNSQITTVANMTRDYSVATVNVDVDFAASPDEVLPVLTEAAMSVRNDPAFKDAFLADPTLLGVDAVKGSVVTYPILLKTLANQQWGAKRELQRRVRLALEAHHLLPGDPLRVFTASGPQALGGRRQAEAAEPGPAPELAPAGHQDINPLTGEGL